MKKIANPSISPAIQNAQMDMSGGAPAEQSKDEIFKKLFTDRAYKSFTAKFPYLMEYISTFKIINSSVDDGYAVGAFFITIQSPENVYMVPIILKNNAIQPIMFIYDNSMNVFLPMDKDWVDEILKRIQMPSGEVEIPDLAQLSKNNNITGFSNVPYRNVGGVNSIINKLGSINIPEAVKGLDKTAKVRFLNMVKGNEKVAQLYFNRFDLDAIKKSFEVSEKTAEETVIVEDISVATPSTPLDMIKKEFKQDHVVMDDIANRGYHVQDKRKTENQLVVFTDYLKTLENPSTSGVYDLYLATGKVAPALVLQDPVLIDSCEGEIIEDGSYYGKNKKYKSYHVVAKNQCFVLFPDGNYSLAKNDNIMSTPVLAESIENSDIYKYVYGDKTSEIPLNKPFIFLKKNGNGYITTGPITVKTKTSENDAITCSTNYGSTTIIYSNKYKGSKIYVTNNNTVFVPDTFKVIPLKERIDSDLIIGSMQTITKMTESRLLEHGGKPVTIVKDDRGDYGVETSRPMKKYKTIIKVAKQYDVNAKEVELLMDTMEKKGMNGLTAYVLPKAKKLADVFNKEAEIPASGMIGPMQGTMDMPMSPASQVMPGQEMMPPQMPAPQMPPEAMMDQGVELAEMLDDEGIFDTSALMSLAYVSKLEDLFPKYLPNLIQSMDNIARILLNFWINSKDIEDDIGVSGYENLENKLKTLFQTLSDLLLTLNKKLDIFSFK